MKEIDNYIIEKLHINKDSKAADPDEINEKMVSDLKAYFFDKWGIKFNDWRATINISNSKNYILITLHKYKYAYPTIRKQLDDKFKNKLEKQCSSNNQSIYVYPKYE